MKKNLVELQNVSKIYQMDSIAVRALDNVSLVIKRGEFVSIMGPSGSGKSTLMYLLGCLDTPTLGKIFLEGKDVSKLSESELAKIRNGKIGFVFQTFNLLPRMTAMANVSLPLLYAGKSAQEQKDIALKVLEEVGLQNRQNHFPNQLSGGEQQRVAIARAIANQPSILLADEPTGNLDTKVGEEVIKTFKKLHQKGNTIVLVTHDPHIARAAKRIIKIRDGRVI